MRRKRFTTGQIIRILKEAEVRIKFTELCRKYGISEQTSYIFITNTVLSKSAKHSIDKNLPFMRK